MDRPIDREIATQPGHRSYEPNHIRRRRKLTRLVASKFFSASLEFARSRVSKFPRRAAHLAKFSPQHYRKCRDTLPTQSLSPSLRMIMIVVSFILSINK
jgi:hypothetical protein